jgi:hypothetical protein
MMGGYLALLALIIITSIKEEVMPGLILNQPEEFFRGILTILKKISIGERADGKWLVDFMENHYNSDPSHGAHKGNLHLRPEVIS